MANIIIGSSIQRDFEEITRTRAKGEVAISWHREMSAVNAIGDEECYDDMKMFRRLIKQGVCSVRKCNNVEFTFNGKTFYTLIVNAKTAVPAPISLHVGERLVNGYEYHFYNKQNRDKLYEYLEKAMK